MLYFNKGGDHITGNSIKILCIGNSFSQDTTTYVAEIAASLGFSDLLVANLYIGGCPIGMHFENIKNDLPAYRYDSNNGSGWVQTPDCKISDAIKSNKWDWICIQHGSSYGGRYTDPESYKDLGELVRLIKAIADPETNVAFNMAWVGEPTRDRPEMLEFNRDQVRYFEAVCAITKGIVAETEGIERVCPAGTAVQNARTTDLNSRLNRDGFHLSLDVGRYLAGLTFFATLTGMSISNISWKPLGVSEEDKALLIKAAAAAIEEPFRTVAIL